MWKDSNDVFMLSNHRDGEVEDIENEKTHKKKIIPCMRNHYNKKARGVDLANQLCSSLRYTHAQRK